tara:strand:- start:584 stop:967 length:384 start_codon:yes stop_codon:yes gene_type:complete
MVEEVKKYRDFVEKEINKINNIYSTITFTTLDEIIKGEMDLNSIWWSLSKINDSSYEKRKSVEKKLNKLSDEDFDTWGYKLQNEVDDLHNLLDWKIMTLQGLLDNLGSFVDYEGIEKYFKDVKQIDI